MDFKNNRYGVFDALPDPAAILDSRRRVVDMNSGFSRLMSTGRDALGRDICDLFEKQTGWDNLSGQFCDVPHVISPGTMSSCEIECPDRSCHFLCTLSPLSDSDHKKEVENDNGPLFLFVMRDISELKEREAAVSKDMQLLKDLLENANDMVQSVDPNGKFLYVNRAWRETMGYSQEDMKSLNLQDILSPECAAKCYTMFAEVMRGGDIGRVETSFIAKDGREIMVEGNCNCRLENGKPVATRGIFRDITEKKQEERDRKELEQHMQQLQKLESLGLMAGGIAHDYNNLLMGILGFAELILVREKPGENIAAYVKNIEQAARRAAELTSQMLAYSGHGRYKVDYLDLSKIVRESQSLFSATVSRKIQLEYDLDSMLPKVEADIDQMRQMLLNLVTNASEAIGEEAGVISIVTGTMHADKDYLTSTYINEKLPEGHYVYLRVEDTGPGIEENAISRIFDPFFTTKFTGRGLGLAAVLGIVRGHRGAIKVYSQPGQGTIITILLPVFKEAVTGEQQTEQAHATEQRPVEKMVLLVDDEHTVRQVASLMIADLGLKVLEARDGHEGFEVFCRNRERIGLVVTDMLMPGMNGLELLSRIREAGSDCPVVLSSGYNKEDIVSSIEEKELAGFIHKPYNEARIQQIVRDIMIPSGENQ